MTPQEIRLIVQEVISAQEEDRVDHEARYTQRAIVATLAVLGIDAEDTKDVREFQEVIAHSRAMMQNLHRFQTVGITTIVTIIIGGLMSALWLGMKGLIK
jgi:predicted HAD superfamily phosphohydrolase